MVRISLFILRCSWLDDNIKWINIWFFFHWISGKTPGNFHVIILNKDVDQAYRELRDFIVKELEKQQAEGVYVSLKPATSTK